MELIQWDKSYSVDNELIDGQHLMLVSMINTMIKNKEASVNSEIISELLTEMTEYAGIHFKTEEIFMEQMEYPKLQEHKNEHKQFRLKVIELCRETMSNNESVPKEVLEFLSKWLVDHILRVDMEYKTFHDTQSTAAAAAT